MLAGEYGYDHISMTVPAIVGKNGIEEIKILELAIDEIEGLKNTVNILRPYMQKVEEYLNLNINL